MSSISDLGELLRLARPILAEGEFVFLALPAGYPAESLRPLCTFLETEGISAIVLRERAARAGFSSSPAFRQITLQVNSSLEAVGFLAAVTRALAGAGIPCNAVSAFHHDHLFVPADKAGTALEVLAALSSSRRGG